MSKLCERIRERRAACGLTLLEIAERLGVKEATVQRYESGEIKNIKHETVRALADIFGCSPQYLMGWTDRLSDEPEMILSQMPARNIFMRPVYNSVAAGFGAIAENKAVDYLPTVISAPSEQELYIWITVKGDSMSPLIDDGSKILIKKQSAVDDGQIGVVLIDGEEAVVKRIRLGRGYVELQSVNPYYPPRRFSGEDTRKLRILGLVKEVSKSLR